MDTNKILEEIRSLTGWMNETDNRPYQDGYGYWYGDIRVYMEKSQRLAELVRELDHELSFNGPLPSDWCNHYRN